MHSTWDVEDEEDKADKVKTEGVANARHLHNTCRTKRMDKVDVATMVVSQLHQEVQE